MLRRMRQRHPRQIFAQSRRIVVARKVPFLRSLWSTFGEDLLHQKRQIVLQGRLRQVSVYMSSFFILQIGAYFEILHDSRVMCSRWRKFILS